jgi:hypothetical protein
MPSSTLPLTFPAVCPHTPRLLPLSLTHLLPARALRRHLNDDIKRKFDGGTAFADPSAMPKLSVRAFSPTRSAARGCHRRQGTGGRGAGAGSVHVHLEAVRLRSPQGSPRSALHRRGGKARPAPSGSRARPLRRCSLIWRCCGAPGRRSNGIGTRKPPTCTWSKASWSPFSR